MSRGWGELGRRRWRRGGILPTPFPPCFRFRGVLHYMHEVHVPPATEEVIHCLQSQGSPAAAEQHCKLGPGRHLEPGGAATSGPFFWALTADYMGSTTTSTGYWRAARAPRYSITFAF